MHGMREVAELFVGIGYPDDYTVHVGIVSITQTEAHYPLLAMRTVVFHCVHTGILTGATYHIQAMTKRESCGSISGEVHAG